MAEPSTFIKLDRNLKDWRWIKSPNTLAVWIWLLMSANIRPCDFENETIQRGQLATSRKTIAAGLGLTERQVRTALDHLKSTGEVSVKKRSKYQVITIPNYDKYQITKSDSASGRSPTEVRQKSGESPQSKNKRTTLKGRRKKEVCVDTHAPTVDEVVAFFAGRGRSRGDAEKFHGYNTMNGWKVDDWQAAAEMWIRQGADTNGGNREPVMQATQPAVETDDFGRPIKKPCTLSDLGFNPADYMTEEELNGS